MNTELLQKILGCVLLLGLVGAAGAQAAQNARHYNTAQAAAEALVAAAKADNLPAMYAILGDAAKDLIDSGDLVTDSEDRASFVAAYEKKHTLTPDSQGKRVFLELGEHNWPFPIPLISTQAGLWHFDTQAGLLALLDRRIGHNELSAIQVCLAYADAQQEYYQRNPEQAPSLHFAAKLASSPGKHDGLYWSSAPGEAQSPLGALAASAEAGGYKATRQGAAAPYYGYHYRILTGQGAHASSGAREYIKEGRMSGGFALVAYPAVYGVSGVMAFIINQDGVVYEKDLGKNTPSLAKKIATFDPDISWEKVDDM